MVGHMEGIPGSAPDAATPGVLNLVIWWHTPGVLHLVAYTWWTTMVHPLGLAEDPKISIFFWLTLLFMYFLKLGGVPFLEIFDWRTPSLPKSQLCDLPFILIINVL